MYWRFAITAGPKSLVPFGKVGFSITAQYDQDLRILGFSGWFFDQDLPAGRQV
jgi:hypothetical protein